MFNTSISNRRLHCCLVTFVLTITILLVLSLLLFQYRYEFWKSQWVEDQNEERNFEASPVYKQNSINKTNNENSLQQQQPVDGRDSLGIFLNESSQSQLQAEFKISNNMEPINCTKFAIDSNLTLANENGYCPTGTFPCQSCPDICIEQWKNCNGNEDCPDKSDESSCNDSNGAYGSMFTNIVKSASRKRHQSFASSTYWAKPNGCTEQQFDSDKCSCDFSDSRSIICVDLGLTEVPSTFEPTVIKIRLSNNSITSIDNVRWPKSLISLVIMNNSLSHIGKSAFELSPNLSNLYLTMNNISRIDPEAFVGLTRLRNFHIDRNNLDTFNSSMLLYTPMIDRIYLDRNQIDLPFETSFSHCQNLKELFMDDNRISIIRSHWFQNMTSLYWLSLANNRITVIEEGAFKGSLELNDLNLSSNRIKFINRQTFATRLNIIRLYLAQNPLEPLPTDVFMELLELKSLNLTHVKFDYINNGTFTYLRHLDFIYFEKFRYCHYAAHVRVCEPKTDGVSTFQDLLAFPTLKYAVWIVASVCTLGNVFVFIWRTVSQGENKTISLCIRNLAVADLMMAVYLSTIGWQDMKFEHKFGVHAVEWMSSWNCTAIGFLAVFSSELSVFILTIITVERYRAIMSKTKSDERFCQRRAKVYVITAWLVSFLIAFYPLVVSVFKNTDYYSTNGLCLPLHIDQPSTRGWLYSAFVYLGINFSAVVIIMVLYIHMYTIIINGRQETCPALLETERREDAVLAIRFFFIVVTDCLCWIPIVVIKVMALCDYSISSTMMGWLVVFIIPINSALNPIIYTLAAPTSLWNSIAAFFGGIRFKVNRIAKKGSSYSSQSSGSGNSSSEFNAIGERSRARKNGSNSTSCGTFETFIIIPTAKGAPSSQPPNRDTPITASSGLDYTTTSVSV